MRFVPTMRLWNDKNESFDKDLFNDSGDLLADIQSTGVA